jgi:Methane oxygenase PmoA
VPELKITHARGSHVDVAWGDVTLFRYVHRPDVPQLESPKPYLHPVRTLAGELVTAYRPHDHVWHKGIQLALPHVGQENFWGGVTWVRGKGYEQLANNGSMDHAGFEALEADGDRALIDERLRWHTQAGEHWIDERRTLAVRVPGDATWVLSWASELENRSGHDLVLGSPTTNGRPDAGYGGLLWRGPAGFAGGEVLVPGGGEAMGARGSWLAFVGPGSTLAFLSGAEPPWFVRSEPFAVAGPAPWFHEEETLAAGDTLELRCDIAIADGAWTADDVEAFRTGAMA